jgi:predicted AAA+ superfamily ATPase
MSPPTIYELCRPRADVLEGRIRDEDFAADLSQVLKGTAPELYKNPAVFFANTHPTRGLRDLFLAVVDRLTGSGSQLGSILRLDTSYGGGKTHALIGLNHILTAADQIPNLGEFIDPARLPSQKVTVRTPTR